VPPHEAEKKKKKKRMKAQADSNRRGQKDFICREEKRKTV
jgi:hypothetical protein